MELFLIRHGQTDYNAQRRWQGRVDVPLNIAGREQAVKIRELLRLETIRLAKIYTSPLVRATETADIISNHVTPIFIDERLVEINLGDYDGRYEDDISQEIGKRDYENWRSRNFTLPAPGGESIADVMVRAKDFLDEIAKSKSNEQLGIVAHQGLLIALKSVISGQSELTALDGYKQMNSEVDVWEIAAKQRLRTIKIQQIFD